MTNSFCSAPGARSVSVQCDPIGGGGTRLWRPCYREQSRLLQIVYDPVSVVPTALDWIYFLHFYRNAKFRESRVYFRFLKNNRGFFKKICIPAFPILSRKNTFNGDHHGAEIGRTPDNDIQDNSAGDKRHINCGRQLVLLVLR